MIRKLLLVIFSLMLSHAHGQEFEIDSTDIVLLFGEWEGSLTYLDYQSGEAYEMPCIINFRLGKNDQDILFDQRYPDEPKANNNGKIKIAKDRKSIDGHPIVYKERKEDGSVEYQVLYKGKDDNKEAMIRVSYLISKNNLENKKEVQFLNEEDWILRNIYSYKKK